MKYQSPAKINLFLQVTGKRNDGFHELFTLMCCINLYDNVNLYFGKDDLKVICDYPGVPADSSNIAYKAADLFLKRLNKKEGVHIVIEKHIPVGAGLGGGSSNAAIVLKGLNEYYNFPFSKDELISIGLLIGADVPFFINEKPSIAEGIGEKLEFFEGLKPFYLLLVYPGFGISTAEVYKNLSLRLTKCKKNLRKAFLDESQFNVVNYLCNDLETVTELKYPEIIEIKETLLKSGAKGALMSGSGSSVFGIFFNSDEALKAYQVILQKKNKWQIFLVNPLI